MPMPPAGASMWRRADAPATRAGHRPAGPSPASRPGPRSTPGPPVRGAPRRQRAARGPPRRRPPRRGHAPAGAGLRTLPGAMPVAVVEGAEPGLLRSWRDGGGAVWRAEVVAEGERPAYDAFVCGSARGHPLQLWSWGGGQARRRLDAAAPRAAAGRPPRGGGEPGREAGGRLRPPALAGPPRTRRRAGRPRGGPALAGPAGVGRAPRGRGPALRPGVAAGGGAAAARRRSAAPAAAPGVVPRRPGAPARSRLPAQFVRLCAHQAARPPPAFPCRVPPAPPDWGTQSK